MNKTFPFIIGLSAFVTAACAGFFSVTGLATLFGGAYIPVLIMASSLEFAKLVSASFLYRYWNEIGRIMKIFMTTAVAVLVLITSAGIYGFLSGAYTKTEARLGQVDGQIAVVDAKKKSLSDEIARLNTQMDAKNKRINSITELRIKQEQRIDDLYAKGMVSSARKTEQGIKEANKDIAVLSTEVDELSKKVQKDNEEIAKFDSEILDHKGGVANAEIGPLKYIAELTGYDMKTVVNFFMLLIIFVFDPLAMSLVIATNFVLLKNSKPGTKIVPALEPVVIPESTDIKRDSFSEQLNTVADNILAKKAEQDLQPVYSEPAPEPEPELENVEPVSEPDPNAKTEEGFQKYLDENEKKMKTDKEINLELLSYLFNDGLINSGEELPLFKQLRKVVPVSFSDNAIKVFIKLCNYLDIADIHGSQQVALMNYDQAQIELSNYYSMNKPLI